MPAQNNNNLSADLIILANNYVFNSEYDENVQKDEINQNEEQNEGDDNMNNKQNNENGNDNSNLNNSMDNEQNNGNLNISNNENNNNLFSNRIDEIENKIEDKDKNYNKNINNSNRNISGEINDFNSSSKEKNDLNGSSFNNQNKGNIVNFMTIDKEYSNVIDKNVNNDLNQSKLINKIGDNIINFNNTYDNNIFNDNNNNENLKSSIPNNENNQNYKSDILSDRMNNSIFDLINNNKNDKKSDFTVDLIMKNKVTTYSKNKFITENYIKETACNEFLTSNILVEKENENKDNYKINKNLKTIEILDSDRVNSGYRLKRKNKKKIKNELKDSQLSISYKIFLTIIYFLFGHCFIFTNNFLEIIKKDYYKLSFLFIIIPYFFIQILINILLFFPYILKNGFDSFISEFCYIIKFKYNNLDQFPFHLAYYSAKILFLGTF